MGSSIIADSLRDRIRDRAALPPPAECRAIRRRAGLTIEDLAATLGVHRMTVYHWEIGRNMPDKTNVGAYRRLLQEIAEEIHTTQVIGHGSQEGGEKRNTEPEA
jgi:DNA-binding transcriptional regulator YiaG